VRVSGAGYKSRPSGRLGAEFVSFFRNTWLRSLRASLFFRSRWKRALSPLRADMMAQEYQNPAGVDRQLFRQGYTDRGLPQTTHRTAPL